jgi:hypothetical protein
MAEWINRILTNAKNIPGWSTKRKIVVFESDDWGTIRTPNRKTLEQVSQRKPVMQRNDFYRYDTLATANDLDDLFNVLSSVKDRAGRAACFTPFCNVVNPDFEKMKEHDLQQYFYEPFTKTLERYYPGQRIFEKWQSGMTTGIWRPEFHGREHINVPKWLKLLRKRDDDALFFFNHEMAHFPFQKSVSPIFQSLAPTYFYDSPDEIEQLKDSLVDGLKVFKTIFGYDANSFCPPNAIFSTQLEEHLAGQPLKAIAVERNRIEPSADGPAITRNYLFKYGKPNRTGQVYYRRNAKFEPIQKDFSLNRSLSEVEAAFRWGKPAVISTHRLNFVSALSDDQKAKSLQHLQRFLTQIVARWGDVEFLSSGELVKLIGK